ncbi:hypothetical protein NIES4075_68350 [Tolypothrix sp. NIES-4075]|uniref:hypothetical protein n=1 Tax=Tolypothrix sp. NIES-4075 TaxID=2005459 RepID=UPI000B6C2691|nr:hypothetical protein [Tolypothrix sp. NIES-4075]GAX45814.1 hypothetical protein NIES4075_68350 [Tolypothrix sp. NIES-4075]
MDINREALLSMTDAVFEKYCRNAIYNAGLELEAMGHNPEIPIDVCMQKLQQLQAMNEQFAAILAERDARKKS